MDKKIWTTSDLDDLNQWLDLDDLKQWFDDFKQWLDDLKSSKRNDYSNFSESIGGSPFVKYHYSLCTDKSLDEELRNELWFDFGLCHREKATELLLSKLDNNEDTEFYSEIINCLVRIVEKVEDEKRVLEYARKFVNADDAYLRYNAIGVLCAFGSKKDFPLLGEHLQNDINAHCRAWAALYFTHRKRQSWVDKALPYLKQAISQETDYYALSMMIEAVKELTGKNFGLSQKAMRDTNKEKIDAAKQKVERFFKERYNE